MAIVLCMQLLGDFRRSAKHAQALQEWPQMPQGTIKKVVPDRGFGFISGEKGDVFFHHSVVADGGFDQLQEGQAVEYQVEQGGGGKGAKGPRASSVKPM